MQRTTTKSKLKKSTFCVQGFHVAALCNCLQWNDEFFRAGLEAQQWKGPDCIAVACFLWDTLEKVFFFLLTTFLGPGWAQIQTNAFLLVRPQCFAGATVVCEKSCEASLVSWLRIAHFVFCCPWRLVYSCFHSPTVRLVPIFHRAHVRHSSPLEEGTVPYLYL